MRDRRKTQAENIQDFNRLLQEAIDLGSCPIGSNVFLHGKTIVAINAVAQAYPDIDSKLIQNARKEFAKELDGVQVSGVEQEIERVVKNHYST